MQAKSPRAIQDGKAYRHLIPKAKLTETTVKRGATVQDTVGLIPQVVAQTKWQTKGLAKQLKADTLYATCRNIWEFIYNNIRYHKDDEGIEQIRSPARAWHDRARGVDCDCYTVFISTILANLQIPHLLRITKYKQDYFQHIYPVVPTKGGGYITIDCVVDSFNYEEPYKEKQDTPMDLQFLEGLDDMENDNHNLMGEEEVGELGKKGWFKKFTHNALHLFNRVNPATVLLRNGILACLKLNLFKVAQRMKYAYMTEDQAKKRGVDMGKWHKLVQIKDKLENIFYGAGGIPSNFKKAMLTGNGNRNHDVSGLGYAPDEEVFGMDENTPLPQLLGEIYDSENKLEGLGNLGDPATGTAIAAATGIMGIIATIIKTVGNIFPKKDDGSTDKAAGDFQTTTQDDAAASNAAGNASSTDQTAVTKASDNTPATADSSSDSSSGDSSSGDSSGDPNKKQGFWEKNKKWLKPAVIVTAIAGAAFGGYKFLTSDKKKSGGDGLTGLKGKKGKNKKKPVALL